MAFEVIPAIDLMDGSCVRLQQGDAKRKTRYEIAPEEVAAGYQAAGARRLHVVDLDGAFSGSPKNLNAIKAIRAAAPDMVIEVGGGIRDEARVDSLFEAGINHAVIGTSALENREFLGRVIKLHGDKIIVGADAREGKLATRGWTADTDIYAIDFLRGLREEMGLSAVIFTDIARDGMFTAPNYEAYDELLQIDGLGVIASGGVGALEHITHLARLNSPFLQGVIVGKALYDGRITLQDALQAAKMQHQ